MSRIRARSAWRGTGRWMHSPLAPGSRQSPSQSDSRQWRQCRAAGTRWSSAGGRAPAIVVLQADDVIFTKVVAVLHFHEDQRGGAGVVDPVRHAEPDVDRGTRVHRHFGAVERDDAVALDDEPVLGPPGVPLVAEPLPGMHLDRLDLEGIALSEHGVTAPRALRMFRHLAHPARSD